MTTPARLDDQPAVLNEKGEFQVEDEAIDLSVYAIEEWLGFGVFCVLGAEAARARVLGHAEHAIGRAHLAHRRGQVALERHELAVEPGARLLGRGVARVAGSELELEFLGGPEAHRHLVLAHGCPLSSEARVLGPRGATAV